MHVQRGVAELLSGRGALVVENVTEDNLRALGHHRAAMTQSHPTCGAAHQSHSSLQSIHPRLPEGVSTQRVPL